MRRRNFLAASGSSMFAASLAKTLWALPHNNPYMKSIGLQLWTVRNQLSEDIPKTLKAVADAGYQQIELMRTLDADAYLPAAKDLGLKTTSAFIDWRSLGQPGAKDAPSFDKILEKAQEIGLKHLVFGYIGKGRRETLDHYKSHADQANAAGEKCRQAGIQLSYHNHSFEFAPLPSGKTGFDVLVERFDKKLVQFEVDVFWVAIGGRDPLKTIRDLKGRVAQIHLKDLQKGAGVIHDEGQVPHETFKELGAGVIDMAAVLKAAEEAGAEQCHVEQDQSPAPLKSIRQSLKHLRKL